MRLVLTLLLLVGCVPTPPPPATYTVVRGDTLGEIATAHEVTVDQLRRWNGIEGDLIEVGQVLIIETGAPQPPAPPTQPRTRPKAVTKAPRKGVAEGTLVMPTAKSCLPPPDTTADADGMSTTASQGLSPAQVGAAIDRFLPRTTSCVVGDSGTVTVDIKVACTGLVQSVIVVSDTGLPDVALGCIADRLRYAEFPAHALPAGEEVRIPLTYAYTPPSDLPTAGP